MSVGVVSSDSILCNPQSSQHRNAQMFSSVTCFLRWDAVPPLCRYIPAGIHEAFNDAVCVFASRCHVRQHLNNNNNNNNLCM